MKFSEANDLLEPGYLEFESGYRDVGDGKKTVAALTRMRGCKPEMVDWWFSWLGGTDQYKWWHPVDHLYSAWEDRIDGKYIGGSHIVDEYLAGPSGPVFKLRISFHEPSETFDAARFKASGAVAICARIGDRDDDFYFGRMCHYVRRTDTGCEMRSRFWLGEITPRDPAKPMSEERKRELVSARLNTDLARRLHQHCTEEMSYLAEIMPTLYARETGDTRI